VDPDAEGTVSVVGRGMGVLDGVAIVEGEEQFLGWIWASHCNQRGLCDAALPKLLSAGFVHTSLSPSPL